MARWARYLLAVWCLHLVGCVTGINENVVRLQTLYAFDNYEKIRKVAIVPFGGYFVTHGEKVVMGVPQRITEDNGSIMSDIVADELSKRATFKVVPPERVADYFKKRKEKIWGLLTPKEIQRVGALLKADALVLGQVQDMSVYRYRTYNNSRIIAQIRMVDSHTAEPIWRGNIKLDEEGKPHDVARRGVKLLLDQLDSKRQVLGEKKAKPISILDR